LESRSTGDSAIAITSCAQNSQRRLSVEVQNELTAREPAVQDKRAIMRATFGDERVRNVDKC
jgi:hypothetical protein